MKGFDFRLVEVPRLLQALHFQARRAGDKWEARCPSGKHPDRNPSWEINDRPGADTNGCFRCWSCGYKGTAYQLVQDVLGFVTAAAAVEWLIENAMGAPTDPALDVEVRVASHLRQAFSLPLGFTRTPLAEWVTPARRYAESRGITAQQVQRWGLGYATYGRLAGRLVLPVYDAAGQPLSYSARAFGASEKTYLTPHRSECADQGAVFGEQHWPPTAKRFAVVLTEGSIDALACERAGAPCIASLGGAAHLDPMQIAKLATFQRVVILTDNDPAGDMAAVAVSMALARHVRHTPRIVPPPGLDAAKLPEPELNALLLRAWVA